MKLGRCSNCRTRNYVTPFKGVQLCLECLGNMNRNRGMDMAREIDKHVIVRAGDPNAVGVHAIQR